MRTNKDLKKKFGRHGYSLIQSSTFGNPLMKSMKIQAREWKKYFKAIDAEIRHKPTHIDGDSLGSDGQLQCGWTRLDEISYDSELDICRISVSGQLLQFKRLQDIHLVCDCTGLSTIEIKGTDGVKHIVRFREPLPLPAVAIEVY